MGEFINNLISLLEPTVVDLGDKNKELQDKKKLLSEIDEMLMFVDDDIKKVASFKNQQLIVDNLSGIDSNITEYKACCYLLNSDDKNVQLLPQYIESSNYIANLLDYFKKWQEELKNDVTSLEVVCDEKTINKKYLDVFKKENPVVYDVDEFSNFIEKQELSNKDKIDILVYIINSNLNDYLGKRKS